MNAPTPDTQETITGVDAALAAEYVLGVLPEEEAAQISARIAVEPALADEVAFWQIHLSELAEAEVSPVAPPPQVKAWIEGALDDATPRPRIRPKRRRGRRRAKAAAATAAGAPDAATQERPRRQARRRRGPGFFSGLFFGGLLMGLAAIAYLAVQTGLRLPDAVSSEAMPPPAPGYLARLDAPGLEAVALLRTVAGERGALLELFVTRAEPPGDRIFTLWLMTEAGAALDLGTVPASGRLAVPVAPLPEGGLAGAALSVQSAGPTGAIDPGQTPLVRAPLTPL